MVDVFIDIHKKDRQYKIRDNLINRLTFWTIKIPLTWLNLKIPAFNPDQYRNGLAVVKTSHQHAQEMLSKSDPNKYIQRRTLSEERY